jgi:hypothetical protein
LTNANPLIHIFASCSLKKPNLASYHTQNKGPENQGPGALGMSLLVL